jgi:hypothetical protein
MTDFKVAFKIHPKPDGGFEAVSEDPPIKLEGATREEVEQQVRARLVQMLGPEVAAMLPVNFVDKSQQTGESRTSFTVKKTIRIGSSLKSGDANIASTTHAFTTGGRTAAGPPYSTPAGDIVSASSAADDNFGPIRRTGDGSPAMLMLRILIAGVVILAIMYFLRSH